MGIRVKPSRGVSIVFTDLPGLPDEPNEIILFHGGCPWVGETGAILLRHWNHGWIDSVWLPSLSYSIVEAQIEARLTVKRQPRIFNVSTQPKEVVMPTVQTWGNSLAVRIPAAIASQLSVTSGTEVELSVSNGALLVKPTNRHKYRLKDLLKDCRPTQLHGEIDFGPDVGREVID